MNPAIKAIFFDVGNTLLFPNRDRIHLPLKEKGVSPSPEQLRSLECRMKNEFDAAMVSDGSHDKSFWLMFYTQLLADLGVNDDSLRDRLVSSIRDSGNWDQIRPGTREHLQEIAKEFQIAVISNADGRIEDVLRRCGIADCFLTITDSGLVGHEKPHPEIFRQALQTLQAKPEESVYVGDMYSVDYLGATGAGMQAVLMDVPGAYKERGVARVETLDELRAKLADGLN